MNPLLRDFSFAENANRFTKNLQQNPFVNDYMKFINVIKYQHKPGGVFMKFSYQMLDKYLNATSPEEAVARHVEFYYISPLLVRSIFSRSLLYLKNKQKPKLAEGIIKDIQQLNLGYGWEALP